MSGSRVWLALIIIKFWGLLQFPEQPDLSLNFTTTHYMFAVRDQGREKMRAAPHAAPLPDSDDEEEICPLCCETLDLTDKNFFPCPCGYQVGGHHVVIITGSLYTDSSVLN